MRYSDIISNNYNQLDEKLIMFNQGKKYGQIVFMAGGAGSGKGFAQKNFMEVNKFKVRDVDEWKRLFIELDKIFDRTSGRRGVKTQDSDTGRRLQDFDLSDPRDVYDLHGMLKQYNIKSGTLKNILGDLRAERSGRLPNLLFDITFKDLEDISEVTPNLIKVGYEPKNIHVVWVLANYHMAVARNQGRDRVVPDDILLATHEGAFNSMYDVMKNKAGNFNFKLLFPYLIGSIPFAFIGGSMQIEKELFEIILFFVLGIAGILLLFNFKSYKDNSTSYKALPLYISIIIGTLLGFISGIVGIGGGIFLSPILYLFRAANPKHITVAISLFILINSIFGIIGQLSKNQNLFDIKEYLFLLLVVFVGGQIGNILNLKLFSTKILALITSLLVIFVAIRLGLNIYNF